MKSTLAGLLAAAAVLPASAAVINYSWNSSGGYQVFGTITYNTGNAVISDADITAGTITIISPSAVTLVNNAAIQTGAANLDVSFHDSPNLRQQGGSSWFVQDGSGSYFLSMTEGDSGSGFVFANGDFDTGGDDLVVVPEPEMIAAVAGVGLVAFGLARRRFAKN